MAKILGIDVSENNGSVNWSKVKSGIGDSARVMTYTQPYKED